MRAGDSDEGEEHTRTDTLHGFLKRSSRVTPLTGSATSSKRSNHVTTLHDEAGRTNARAHTTGVRERERQKIKNAHSVKASRRKAQLWRTRRVKTEDREKKKSARGVAAFCVSD